MKTATTISFIIFVGIFVILAIVLPVKEPLTQGSKVKQNVSTTNNGGIKVVQNTGGKNTTTTTNTVATTPKLNTAEVSKHNIETDCYLIVKNKVYDVSTYISKHPGGRRKIVNTCGEEVSSVFASIHSNFAWNLLNDYYVGNLQ